MVYQLFNITPDSKVHGANMGPIWGRQDPGGPHVGPINIAIWDVVYININSLLFKPCKICNEDVIKHTCLVQEHLLVMLWDFVTIWVTEEMT